MKKEDTAVLVLSCDKYSDIWPTFYDFFFKYWNDCPFKIYHASNFSSYNHPRITNIHSNQVSDWSTETKTILKQIEEKYVIIILEDYFIYQNVDLDLLERSIEVMKKSNALFLKLSCSPSMYNSLWEYDIKRDEPFIGIIRPNQQFRINLQVGVWNKDLLFDIIKEGESPWLFETRGSVRSNEFPNPCLCIVEDPTKNYVHGPITYLCTALSKGVWMRDAIELSKKENINLNIGDRKIETKFEYFYRRIYTKTPLSKRKYLDFIKHKFFNFQYS